MDYKLAIVQFKRGESRDLLHWGFVLAEHFCHIAMPYSQWPHCQKYGSLFDQLNSVQYLNCQGYCMNKQSII